MLLRILGISLLTLLLSSSVAGARSVEKPKSVRTSSGAVMLDFADVALSEVARTLSLAYGTSILTDDAGDVRVTFHLEGVSLFEGLTSLCAAHGLDVVLEGRVYHIRRSRVQNGSIALSDSGVVVDVQNMNVREFVKEFGLNTGVNVLADYDVDGVVSGNLRGMVPEMAFRVLMESNGFKVRGERGCLRVSRAKAGNGGKALNGSPDGAEVSVERAGDLYSVDLQSASLKSVLKAIAEEAGLNLAVYGDLNETVQMSFKDVSLPELLASLFRGSAFTFRLDSSSLWVSEEGAKALADVQVFPLKHVSPEKAMAQLSKFMKGSELNVSEYREQNSLVLGGSPRAIARAAELLKMVDVPQMQVTLACVIVEFRKGRGFAIGVRSGATRNVGERDIQVRGFFDFLGKDISKSGAFGKIGILPDRFELELSSMEENNEAKVLARPRVTTLNGNKAEQAELNVTNTVYYLVSQVSADGYPITDYRSFNDGISLELTPTMTQDGLITLSVSPEIKTAGRSTGDGPRDISSRNMKTTVVLRDGETLCLGGLIRKNKTEVRQAVPFLGSIPILGRLFSYTSEEEDESELAIFITPSVETKE